MGILGNRGGIGDFHVVSILYEKRGDLPRIYKVLFLLKPWKLTCYHDYLFHHGGEDAIFGQSISIKQI